MKPNYFVSWGNNLIFNINEVITLKHVANEMIRTKLDIEKEEDLIEASLPFHEIPKNMDKLTMADNVLNEAITFLHYGQLKLKNTDKKLLNLPIINHLTRRISTTLPIQTDSLWSLTLPYLQQYSMKTVMVTTSVFCLLTCSKPKMIFH